MAVAPVFVTEDVSVYYDSFQTVANVSLAIYENEITAFIGSSGSGKSTMLRALNRMGTTSCPLTGLSITPLPWNVGTNAPEQHGRLRGNDETVLKGGCHDCNRA